MTGLRPQTPKALESDRRPLWRHPAILFLAALLLVLLLVRLVSGGSEPQDEAAGSAQSSANNSAPMTWPDFTGPTGAPAGPQAADASPGSIFIAKLNLQPRLINGQVKGYVVRPDDPAILNGTPLQSGDVLLEVDGLALDPARAAALAQSVGHYQDVYIRFERGNAGQDGILPLGRH